MPPLNARVRVQTTNAATFGCAFTRKTYTHLHTHAQHAHTRALLRTLWHNNRICPLCACLQPPAGQLGDVFRESATIAHTYARAYLASKDVNNKFLTASSVHVHVPQVGFFLILLCICVCLCVL